MNKKSKIKSIPKIVCLIGSIKFKKSFIEITKRETLLGNVVLTAPTLDQSYTKSNTNTVLDQLFIMKMELADEIIVVQEDGIVKKVS